MFRYYGILGISLILLSYFLRSFGITIASTEAFVIGYWLFFDALDFKLSGTSVLHNIKKQHSLFFYLIMAGVLIGLFFDFFGAIVADLWAYPGINVFFVKSILFGYGIPILMYYSVYRVILWLVNKEKFGRKLIAKKGEIMFFRTVIYLGAILTLVPVLFIPFLGNLAPVPRGLLFAFTLVGGWFILEGIEYRQHKRSLLKDIFEGYWNPAVALVIAAIITGISWEFLNTMDFRWWYKNVPFSQVDIFGIPIWVLLGWIPLFIIYLSFYRVMSKSDKVF